MDVWKGDIILNTGHPISDIHLSTLNTKSDLKHLPRDAQLHFQAFVDPLQIPLRLVIGPKLDVWTSSEETEGWFSSVLLSDSQEGQEDTEWWHTARRESPLAILASVKYKHTALYGQLRTTEILFLAARNTAATQPSPPTPPASSQGNDLSTTSAEPAFTLQAFTLCSDLIGQSIENITPPPSPLCDDAPIQGKILPTPTAYTAPKPVKRKSVSETFAAAEEIRKRARLKYDAGQDVPLRPSKEMPTLKEMTSAAAARATSSSSRPSTAGVNGSTIPAITRALSRSPSIASTTSLGKRGTAAATQPLSRSNLACVQSSASNNTITPVQPSLRETARTMAASAEPGATEQKNKDTISRLVMAGMRLHGLVQTKVKPGTTMDMSTKNGNNNNDNSSSNSNEEYKLIYHTTLKGVLFAFRAHVGAVQFHLDGPCMDKLREVVDRLLSLYCGDPLAVTECDDVGPGSSSTAVAKLGHAGIVGLGV